MHEEQLDQLAKEAGVLEEALVDVRARVAGRFAGEEPTPSQVKAWLEDTLAAQAPHLFAELTDEPHEMVGVPQAVWDHASASQKLTWAREAQGMDQAPKPRRPVATEAPEDVRQTWAHLPLFEQMTAYRAWRDQARSKRVAGTGDAKQNR